MLARPRQFQLRPRGDALSPNHRRAMRTSRSAAATAFVALLAIVARGTRGAAVGRSSVEEAAQLVDDFVLAVGEAGPGVKERSEVRGSGQHGRAGAGFASGVGTNQVQVTVSGRQERQRPQLKPVSRLGAATRDVRRRRTQRVAIPTEKGAGRPRTKLVLNVAARTTKDADRAVRDGHVRANEAAEARVRLGLLAGSSLPHLQGGEMVVIGDAPGPLQVAERLRQPGAARERTCLGTCCVRTAVSGYLCVDDYGAASTVCNPVLTYRADACAGRPPRDHVDAFDTIVRRYLSFGDANAAARDAPRSGRSDVYFSYALPAEPRSNS